ncbi:MAG TPA: KamA family radical SAM protein [Polyangiaceae bacterium]|nr:KamA family radical SAM protein [Polyangiaceae bacterium]
MTSSPSDLLQLSPPRKAQDWRWQLQHALNRPEQLAAELQLSDSEARGLAALEERGFPVSITPYYFGLIDRQDTECPIRRQVVPRIEELELVPGDLADPLGEAEHEVAPNLISRYPDRALLFATDRCAVYCRFCTRSRLVGAGGGARPLARLAEAFAYLRQHPEITDVIISGGDPLVMGTERLVALVEELRSIPSVETLRLATRVPVVLPQRVTDELIQALRPHHPIWIMTHFNHPRELTPEAAEACVRLADGGFPVLNHTVLLRGVNDDAELLARLFRGLVRLRVRPYYLLQADPVQGTGHLRTPLQTGIDIMQRLQGRLSGIALPKLIVDTPGGLGKVPVGPDYVVARTPGVTRFRTHRGVEVDYLDPPVSEDAPSSRSTRGGGWESA